MTTSARCLPRRAILGMAAASLATSSLSQTRLVGPLVATALGGTTERTYNRIVYEPFTRATGVRVQTLSTASEEALARMIAEAQRPTIDMFHFTGGQELHAAQRGLTQPVGDLGGAAVPAAFRDPNGQWVAVAGVQNGILYNTKYISAAPRSILDFLKPEYRGRVGLAAFSNTKGLDFLVMLSRARGGSEANTDGGFDALGEMVRHGAKIFTVAAQMKTLFAQEEIWLAYYDIANAQNAAEQGLPIDFAAPAEGMSLQLMTHVIARNSTKGDTARAAIAAALQPRAQRELAERLAWTPVNPATDLPPELAAKMPLGEAALRSLVALDREAMNERKPAWLDRFNRMVAR